MSDDRRALLLQALQAVEEMKGKLRAAEAAAAEPIAIIGMGCRFPGGVTTPASYWNLLKNGVDAVRDIPAERWRGMNVPPGHAIWKAGIVPGMEDFDPQFFGISAREAITLDPQQRMLLEVAWEAIEGAGINPRKLLGSRTGVFVGITGHDYGQMVRDSGRILLDVHAATGAALNAASGRISFVLGLQGPAISTDTACSSSLTAVHLACQSLRTGESRLALAGGVNAVLTPDPFICFANWGMMAPDGRCKAFDAAADGFVRAEGGGMVVLKRLSDAVADGDNILALIRGSAVNQDGRSSGLTVPNGPAQEAVIRQALASGRVQAADIDYVEAHGTGTSLGDPIEAHALAAALGAGRDAAHPLVIGSVKTNLGHLEAASGIAGLMKVVLSLQHQHIPPHLHFHSMNPNIDWLGVPVEIPVQGRDWKPGTNPRLAGVSSFGFSGTNAHVILQEAPPPEPRKSSTPERGVHLLALSARSEAALATLSESYERLLSEPEIELGDVCFSANTGRAHFSERAIYVASTREQLKAKLAEGDGVRGHSQRPENLRIAFLFSGQGAQYAGMGRELYESEPVFRAALEACAASLKDELEPGLIDLLYGNATQLLDDTRYTQPALFALEYSLAALWRSWGIEPAAVLGHSVGEYAAACVAGLYSLEDGMRLIAARGRMMSDLPHGEGSMTAILAPREQVQRQLEADRDWVSVAGLNGPENTVISGRTAEVERISAAMTAAGVRVERLRVSHAFHSPLLNPMLDAFAARAGQVEFHAPRIVLVSSLTGQPAKLAELRDPGYWRKQVREPVRFERGIETLAAQGCNVFVEIGPGSTLLGMARACVESKDPLWAPSIRKGRSEAQQMADSLASFYVRGVDVDWNGYGAGRGRRRVTLPTYPFERQRYWIDDVAPAQRHSPAPGEHPLLGRQMDLASDPGLTLWESRISLQSHPWVADHRVQGQPVLPATAYIEMAAAAGGVRFSGGHVRVSNARFEKPFFLRAGAVYEVQAKLEASGHFEVYSREAGTNHIWVLHALAEVQIAPAEDVPPCVIPPPSATVRHIGGEDFYRRFAELGNDWGPVFQGVEYARIADHEGWSRIATPKSIHSELASYRFHPALADASGHILPAIRAFGAESAKPRALVGQAIGQVTFYAQPRGNAIISHARIYPGSRASELLGDVEVFDEDGTLLSALRGAVLRYLEADSGGPGAPGLEDWFHRIEWQPFDPGAAEPAKKTATWLITNEAPALANALSRELAASGISCRVVPDGTVAQDVREPVRVVYTGCVDARAPGLEESAAETTGCAGLLDLVRAIAAHTDARLYALTRGAYAIDGPVASNCMWQAAAWGLGRTLASEQPEIWGGLIDVAGEQDSAWLRQYLLSATTEDQVAVREGSLLAARMERFRPAGSPALELRPDSAYVVTGGFRGIGLEIAHWLIHRGARHLILLARTPLPPRGEWRSVSRATPAGPMVEAVLALEARGATVYPARVDISDEPALKSFFEAYEQDSRPPVRGIVHAAGVLGHAAAVAMTTQEFDRLLAPKAGAWNLHRIFEDTALDFFVLFSSASAILGSPRLGGYAAANAFLDGLARYRRDAGKTALSVNWGMWSETGMATQFAAGDVQGYTERGMGAIRNEEGLTALGRLMNSSEPNAAVLPTDWETWASVYPAYAAKPFLSHLVKASRNSPPAVDPSLRNRLAAMPADSREAAVRERLFEILALVAGFAPAALDAHKPVTEYGLDSLLALEFKNRIEAELGVSVTVVRLLEGASLGQLAEGVSANLTAAAPEPRKVEFEPLPDVDSLTDQEVDAMLADLLAEEVD